MPAYEYQCDVCEVIEKVLRSYDDRKEPWLCEQCGSVMRYLFPTPEFFFEGGSPTTREKNRVKSVEQFLGEDE
ncbi:MAG: FmdB family zinc ribbon protein [Planctomycetota bacterium]|jgi:putative FmdB family regulatory protein